MKRFYNSSQLIVFKATDIFNIVNLNNKYFLIESRLINNYLRNE